MTETEIAEMVFLSSLAQDFIEVELMPRRMSSRRKIPELSSSGLH